MIDFSRLASIPAEGWGVESSILLLQVPSFNFIVYANVISHPIIVLDQVIITLSFLRGNVKRTFFHKLFISVPFSFQRLSLKAAITITVPKVLILVSYLKLETGASSSF